jgi:hypothetical protein
MLVVFGADYLVVGIIEQPLVHLAVSCGIEFPTDEFASLVDQARTRFSRRIEIFPDLCDLSRGFVMDDAVDGAIAVCVEIH